MARIKEMPDRRESDLFNHPVSLLEYETARQKNLQGGYWACVCGSRRFLLEQQTENVKAHCAKCGDCEIIYWNGEKDSAKGSMRRLDTNAWVKAK